MASTPGVTTIPKSLTPNSRSNPSNPTNPSPNSITFNLKPQKIPSFPLKISNCLKKPSIETTPFPQLDLYPNGNLQNPPFSSSGNVSLRLRRLVSEFQSLPQPIDRVKRLLDYAGVLSRLGELTRSPENRVPGCAAQVWLEVEMDELGRVRFRADSDSEITKGFCSCLIFLLDCAYPEDILKVKGEDLMDMNVGLPVRSRVNSWHNVLVSMQERTKNLAAEREELYQLDQLEASSSLVNSDSMINNGEVFASC